MSLYIGLMSGTSMDGIDAVITEQPENTLVCGLTKPYSDEVKRRLEALSLAKRLNLAEICQLNTLIGRDFSSAVDAVLKKARCASNKIKAIGSHGQTVCHDPFSSIPYTLQLGCAHTIASLTGIKVIADFRTKDLVNGGLGAPFAPVYHQELFSKTNESLSLVNIGGIANVSFISPSKPPQGFDTGPGNSLMDAWIRRHRDKCFDREGQWAKEGKVIRELLQCLLSDAYFAKPAPKSIGKEYFSLTWLEPFLKEEYKASDVQATLLALTAQTIALALLANPVGKTVYVCGGGAHNSFLMASLSLSLPAFTVKSLTDANYNPDYIEAMMFSWFAFKTLNALPIDLSGITGSRGPAILGAIYNS